MHPQGVTLLVPKRSASHHRHQRVHIPPRRCAKARSRSARSLEKPQRISISTSCNSCANTRLLMWISPATLARARSMLRPASTQMVSQVQRVRQAFEDIALAPYAARPANTPFGR